MKTMSKFCGKMSTCIVSLLTFLSLHPSDMFAQPPTKTSVCEYKETRQHVPINPQTNQPYTPEERNQGPFARASITKKQIQDCLRANMNVPEDKRIPINPTTLLNGVSHEGVFSCARDRHGADAVACPR
jgi:hypothetical protein